MCAVTARLKTRPASHALSMGSVLPASRVVMLLLLAFQTMGGQLTQTEPKTRMAQGATVNCTGEGRRQDRGLVPQRPWAGRPLAGPWPLEGLESLGEALEPGVPGPQSAEHTASGDSTSQEGVSHTVVGKSSGGKWVLPQSPGRFQPFCSEGNGGKEVKVLSLIWCEPGLTWTEAWPWALGEGRKQQELEKRGSAERGQQGEQQVGDQAPDVFLQMNPGF